ncbi:MAG: pirin family protein [Bacteroidia bacterium]
MQYSLIAFDFKFAIQKKERKKIMSATIYLKAQQVKGQFNGGAILENKPVQMTEDASKLQPYSNLFYWAHAWSDNGSLIGEHPHQAFEIISIVLKGDIEHYDSAHKGWKKLNAGDAQVIRAGSGISHAERINAGSEMFQIWFDPNLTKSIEKPASYNDYASATFPISKQNGMGVKTYLGVDAPMQLDTPGVTIREISFAKGEFDLPMSADKIYSVYLIEGELIVDDKTMHENDFALLKDESNYHFNVMQAGKIFVIESPVDPGYATYAERYR